MQFQYLSKHHPDQLRGGMWQLSWLPMSGADMFDLLAANLLTGKTKKSSGN